MDSLACQFLFGGEGEDFGEVIKNYAQSLLVRFLVEESEDFGGVIFNINFSKLTLEN